MTYDLVAHGARPLVDSMFVANNQANRKVEDAAEEEEDTMYLNY